MRIFKLGNRKSIEERKGALTSQINQINGELYNMQQLDNRDYIYQPVRTVEKTSSPQFFQGYPRKDL